MGSLLDPCKFNILHPNLEFMERICKGCLHNVLLVYFVTFQMLGMCISDFFLLLQFVNF